MAPSYRKLWPRGFGSPAPGVPLMRTGALSGVESRKSGTACGQIMIQRTLAEIILSLRILET